MAEKRINVVFALVDKMSKDLSRIDNRLGGLLKTAKNLAGAFGLAFGSYEVIKWLKSTTEEAMEQEKADFALAEALKNVGAYSEETYKKLTDLASALQMTTTYGDETIESIETLFLRFNIAPELMEKAVQATMDYARSVGKDLRTAALDMAKAAEGNLMMLQRYGVRIDKATFETKGFAAVLDEVIRKFGGAEAAYAATFAGSLEQIKNLFGDLKERIGDAIIKSEGWTTTLGNLKNALIEIQNELINNQGAWSDLSNTAADFVNQMVQGLPSVAKIVGVLGTGVWDLFKVFGSFAGMLGAVFDRLIHRDLKGVKAVWEAWKEDIRAIGQEFENLDKQLQQVQQSQQQVNQKIREAADATNYLLTGFQMLLPILPQLRREYSELKNKMDFVIEPELPTQVQSFVEAWNQFTEQLYFVQDVASDFASTFANTLINAISGVEVKWDKTFINMAKRLAIFITETMVKVKILRAILPEIFGPAAAGLPIPGTSILQLFGLRFKEGSIVQGFKSLMSAFQEGGVVTRPTLALVGEGGEKEYIIPESKFPKPEVFVHVYNANPDTYVEVFTRWSPTGKEKFYREVIKPAAMRSEL